MYDVDANVIAIAIQILGVVADDKVLGAELALDVRKLEANVEELNSANDELNYRLSFAEQTVAEQEQALAEQEQEIASLKEQLKMVTSLYAIRLAKSLDLESTVEGLVKENEVLRASAALNTLFGR